MDFHHSGLYENEAFDPDVCVERHTRNANYTPTYFRLVPAFIRLFDKLGNYNNKIARRP